MRFTRALVSMMVIGLACSGCKPRALSPLHCEGGVNSNGSGMGGECLSVSKNVIDSDPNSVGTGHWESGAMADNYSVRRRGKDQYDMFLNGKLAGAFDRNDNWITVTFTDKPGTHYSLRDDPPGFLN